MFEYTPLIKRQIIIKDFPANLFLISINHSKVDNHFFINSITINIYINILKFYKHNTSTQYYTANNYCQISTLNLVKK